MNESFVEHEIAGCVSLVINSLVAMLSTCRVSAVNSGKIYLVSDLETDPFVNRSERLTDWSVHWGGRIALIKEAKLGELGLDEELRSTPKENIAGENIVLKEISLFRRTDVILITWHHINSGRYYFCNFVKTGQPLKY